MPAGFHPHTNLHSLGREIAVELLRFLRVLQSPLLQFPSVGVHKSNLLEARMVIASYNPHVRLLSPGPWLVGTSKVYPGAGADIVMESITLKMPGTGILSVTACLRQLLPQARLGRHRFLPIPDAFPHGGRDCKRGQRLISNCLFT